jgi:uncharacterized protein YicC (UPF0701 family)
MTGFAVQSRDLPSGTLSVELRAVNSRFLDLIFRMGEDYRALEPVFRERIGEACGAASWNAGSTSSP